MIPLSDAISDRVVAALIGKGGAGVKDLAAQSGARVGFATRPEDGPARAVTLQGSPEALALARRLLDDRIRALLPGHVSLPEGPLIRIR